MKTIQTRKLSTFCEITSGGTPSRDKGGVYFGGDIPWVKSGELRESVITKTEEKLTQLGLENSSAKIFPKHSVLVALYGATVGRTGILEIDAATNQAVAGIIPDPSVADFKYIFYFLQFYSPNLLAARVGGAQPNISQTILKDISVPIPSLAAQQQIAAILEKADAAREKRRQVSQLTEQFLQSAFLEMFGDPATNPKGWGRIEAQKLFEIKLGKMLDEKQYTGKHLRSYLRNVNVQWGKFDLSDIKEMDFEPDDFEKYKLRRGDILVCEGGEVGRCAIWDEQIKDCCYQKALHRLRIINSIIEESYFIYFMRAAAKLGLLDKDTSQVTIAHFTAEKFREFKILVPPLNEQQKFAALVEKVESLRAKQRQTEQELEHLFHSLMQRAFRGELS